MSRYLCLKRVSCIETTREQLTGPEMDEKSACVACSTLQPCRCGSSDLDSFIRQDGATGSHKLDAEANTCAQTGKRELLRTTHHKRLMQTSMIHADVHGGCI